MVEPFRLKLPGEGPALVRTVLKYQRPGEKEPRHVQLEVRLPAPAPPPAK